MQINLYGAEETETFGAALWQALPEKCLVFLYGDLGAGKTTLIRGLLRAAGYPNAVKSPTYSLVEEYDLPAGRRLFHFDLYRLKDPEELEWMGMEDYLRQSALCFIEWPQMGAGVLPAADIEIRLAYHSDGRVIEINVLEAGLKNSLKVNWKNKDILL
ncbi:MAG: tRNA (adenosine(37)-N6)-threonylcarbamoyltransferase complex ATPase subunit type 1 TsaE [Methylomonas sp.]